MGDRFSEQKCATALFGAVETRRALVLDDGPLQGLFAAEASSATVTAKTHVHQNTVWKRMLTLDGVGPKSRFEDSAKKKGDASSSKQGTLMGVYVPVTTSMWGVLIFIRFSIIAGYTGWVMACGFCLLSVAVQVLSTLSLCAVLSNSSNYKGGSFGILKRNLGGELAGIVVSFFSFFF